MSHSSASPANNAKKPGKLISKILLAIVVAFAVFMGFRIIQFAVYVIQNPSQTSPEKAAFREANKSIISDRNGIHLGNSDTAIQLSRSFSSKMLLLRNNLFTQSENDSFSLSGGNFITFCQLDDDSCAFLVHVPELRKFTSDAQDSLVELAWYSAYMTLGEQDFDEVELAVGVKGAMLYKGILIGKYIPDSDEPLDGLIIREAGGYDMDSLHPFFAEPELKMSK